MAETLQNRANRGGRGADGLPGIHEWSGHTVPHFVPFADEVKRVLASSHDVEAGAALAGHDIWKRIGIR